LLPPRSTTAVAGSAPFAGEREDRAERERGDGGAHHDGFGVAAGRARTSVTTAGDAVK